MKKQIAIWLDLKEANFINLEQKENKVETMASEIEHFNVKGGTRSKTPYGSTDTVSDTKFLERKNHQMDAYYKNIMDKVKDAHEILIMGPGEAKVGLRKKMVETKSFTPFIKGYETLDSVSENQKIAFAKEFFGKKKAAS